MIVLQWLCLAGAGNMAEITEAQKSELKKLSKEARVPDMSEIVTTSEEAEQRICDLKEKARIE